VLVIPGLYSRFLHDRITNLRSVNRMLLGLTPATCRYKGRPKVTIPHGAIESQVGGSQNAALVMLCELSCILDY